MEREIYFDTVVRHFKGGIYNIINPDVTHSETKERMVLYSNADTPDIWYVRPYDMFMSKVDKKKYPNVEQEYRFEIIRG